MKCTKGHWTFPLFVSAAALLLVSAEVLAQGTSVRGGTLNVGIDSDWATLDPLGMGALNDRHVSRSIYDTLLELDEKGNLVPGLAESYTMSTDAMSVKLKLRSGIKFHDGTPFDVEAVLFNFKRLMDPANKCRCLSDFATTAEIRAAGPIEIEFKMKSPSAHFAAALTNVSGMMVSPAAVQKYGKNYGASPVGTGPFIFKEWRRGNYFHVTRNPGYWRDGKPYLDEVYYRMMPDDQTRMAALRAGDIDVNLVPAPKDVADMLKDKSLNVIDPPSLGTVFVMFQTTVGPLSDARVRAALAYATDRVAINRALNYGIYKVARTPFGEGLAPHEKVEGFREFNLKKAQAIVKEIGKPIKLKLMTTTAPWVVRLGQALQQMWKRAGIDAEIHQVEQVEVIRAAITHNFEAMLFRWSGSGDPDHAVYQYFHSSKGSNNYGRFSNTELDRLLEAGRSKVGQDARTEVYAQVSTLLARDVPYIFLYYYTPFMLSARNVQGIPKVADGLLRPVDVWKTKQ